MSKIRKPVVVREIDPPSDEWNNMVTELEKMFAAIRRAWKQMFPNDTEPSAFNQYITTLESYLAETKEYDVYAVLNEERMDELKLGFNLSNQIIDNNGKIVNLSNCFQGCLKDIKNRQKNGPLEGEMISYVGLKTLYIDMMEHSLKIAKQFRFIKGKYKEY